MPDIAPREFNLFLRGPLEQSLNLYLNAYPVLSSGLNMYLDADNSFITNELKLFMQCKGNPLASGLNLFMEIT